MDSIQRRLFLGSTIGGLASAALAGRSRLMAQEAAAAVPPPLFGAAGYDPLTLILTWQRDPTTTATVQWLGPETAEDKTVFCKPAFGSVLRPFKTITKPYPNTELRVHRAEATGLVPGSEYQFQIGTTSPVYRFRTMPATATNVIQFVSGGDSGTDEHAIASNILAAKQEPYFALIGGDLAYDNGRSPETFTQFLLNYHAHMVDPQGRLIPMVSCIGNHEVDGGFQGKRTDSPQYLSLFDGLFSERTFGVLDIGDYLSLVLLDTNHIALVAGEQTDWLDRTLAEREERQHVIVANHVPAYPSVRSPYGNDGKGGTGEDQRVYWSPLFERYKVDAVLEHHDHAFKRTHRLVNGMKDKHGVLYLGDGSWGKIRPPHRPEELPYLATVAEAFHVSVHRLEGPRQFHVALDGTGKVADVCQSRGKQPSKRG